jgi:hypothetical protein
LAWLHTAPEPEEKPAKKSKEKKDNLTRLEQILKERDDGVETVEMPACDAVYVIGYLFEIGPAVNNGFGRSSITQLEIEAFQRNTGIELESWEARLLKRLSIEYINESLAAVKEDRSSPWIDAPYYKAPPNIIAQRLKQAMRDLAKL